jgi:hypothetical protein
MSLNVFGFVEFNDICFVQINVSSSNVSVVFAPSSIVCSIALLSVSEPVWMSYDLNVSATSSGNISVSASVLSDGVVRGITFLPVNVSVPVTGFFGSFKTTQTTIVTTASSLVGLLGLLALLMGILTMYFYKRKARILARRDAVEGDNERGFIFVSGLCSDRLRNRRSFQFCRLCCGAQAAFSRARCCNRCSTILLRYLQSSSRPSVRLLCQLWNAVLKKALFQFKIIHFVEIFEIKSKNQRILAQSALVQPQ